MFRDLISTAFKEYLNATAFMSMALGESPLSGKKVMRLESILNNIIEGKTMAEYFVKRPLKRPPIHPGEILREDVLKNLGLSVSEAARRLGVSRQQLHRVLACTHPITTEMALRIGKFAGNGPGIWLRMQQAYDLWHAEHRMADELSKIESLTSDCCNT